MTGLGMELRIGCKTLQTPVYLISVHGSSNHKEQKQKLTRFVPDSSAIEAGITVMDFGRTLPCFALKGNFGIDHSAENLL